MPDISMCRTKKCPRESRCYRQLAKPNQYRQSYSIFEWFIENGFFKCEGYWPVDKEGYGYREDMACKAEVK